MSETDVDGALIERVKRGDVKAFELLVVKYQRRVERLVGRMVRDVDLVQDIAQETFIRAYRALPNFRGESAFYTWLYRIAVNKSIDHLRSKKRKKRFAFLTSLFHDSGEPISDAGDFVHPGVVAENREKAAMLYKAIEKLPETQRVAYLLSETGGLSYAEISEITGSSVSSIESLLFRARKNLRSILADYYKNLPG